MYCTYWYFYFILLYFICRQCAKLLADVSVIQFYPSKFVLVTDILDTFGEFVISRNSLSSVAGMIVSVKYKLAPSKFPI